MNAQYHSSKMAGTTPVPNALFDVVMPTLSDTQLRVLLVVVRSTLGWQDGPHRKERDWLSHRQLQKRTGRAGAAVSGAIDALVKRGLLEVQDGAGERRTTTAARRATRGPLFYRLGEGWTAIGPSSPNEELIATRPSTSDTTVAVNCDSVRLDSEVSSSHLDSTSQRRLHKAKTTKEKETKEEKKEIEIRLDLSSLESEVLSISEEQIAELESTTIEIPLAINSAENSIANETLGSTHFRGPSQSCLATEEQETTDATEIFIQRFQIAYRESNMEQLCPPIENADRELLRRYLQSYDMPLLERWLPAFFACGFGYVRRRAWSLGAFLNCVFVLQAQKNKIDQNADI